MHLYDASGDLSPSAFIPFCDFGSGSSISAMGNMTDIYEIPICKSFQAKILNDQLCYQVDLEKYKSNDNVANDLKSGLVLFLDYNEDKKATSPSGKSPAQLAEEAKNRTIGHYVVGK